MNTIIRSRIYLPMAAMILTAALVVPAAAVKRVPFTGTIQESETDIFQGPPPGTLSVNGSAAGIAIHLGQFTGRFEGAKGSFTLERLLDLTTSFTSGSFHGTITSLGTPHTESIPHSPR